VGLWQLFVQPYVGDAPKYVLGFGSLLFGLGVFAAAVFGKGAPHGSGEGVWTTPQVASGK
jgi:hypothetical protein